MIKKMSNQNKHSSLQQWIVLFFLGVMMRPFISTVYPVIDELKEHLHSNVLIASLLVAIPVFCIGIFSLCAKYIAEHLQKEWVMFISIFLIACSFLIRAGITNTAWILLFTCVGGIGIGIAGALAGNFVQEHFPHKALLSMGIYTVGIALGATLGSMSAAAHTTLFGNIWQFSQVEWAIIIFIFAATWYGIFCRKLAFKNPHIQTEKLQLPFRNKLAWLLTAVFGLQSLIFYGLLTWIVPYYTATGYAFSKEIPAILLAIQLVASWMIPHALEFFKKSMIPLIVLSVILLFSLLALYYAPNTLLWPTLIGLGISTGATFPLCLSNPMLFFKNSAECNNAFSMMFGVGYFFSGFGPLLLATLIDAEKSYQSPFLVLSVFALVMLIVTIFLQCKFETLRKPTTERKVPEQKRG